MARMSKHLVQVPQTEQAHPDQIPNAAGGYSFVAGNWTRLDRFLILGTEGGSYYVGEGKLTRDNAQAVLACIAEDGDRALMRVMAVSTERLAPKNEPAIFVLALILRHGDLAVRRMAANNVHLVCRTGTDLFSLVDHIKRLGGWNRTTRRAVTGWYAAKSPDALAYQMVKYRERHGWTHRHVISQSHLLARIGKGVVQPQRLGAIYWAIDRANVLADGQTIQANAWKPRDQALPLPRIMTGFERAMAATDAGDLAAILTEHGLTHEAVKDELRDDWRVWNALLPAMPARALLRQLGKLSTVGLIAKGSPGEAEVVRKLGDAGWLSGSGIHPMHLFLAIRGYGSGSAGMRARYRREEDAQAGRWTPSEAVLQALDRAFVDMLDREPQINRHILLAVDVSGSMNVPCGAVGAITCQEAAGAMVYMLARHNPTADIVTFATSYSWHKPPGTVESLDRFVNRIGGGGGTDLSQPFRAAREAGKAPYDAILVFTDSETWAGKTHPHTELQTYRQAMNPQCRVVLAQMAANAIQPFQDDDGLSLSIAGLSADLPRLMKRFVEGEF